MTKDKIEKMKSNNCLGSWDPEDIFQQLKKCGILCMQIDDITGEHAIQ